MKYKSLNIILFFLFFTCNEKQNRHLIFKNTEPINHIDFNSLKNINTEISYKDYGIKRGNLDTNFGKASFFLVDVDGNGIFNDLKKDVLLISQFNSKKPHLFFLNKIQKNNLFSINDSIISIDIILLKNNVYEAKYYLKNFNKLNSVPKYNRFFDKVPNIDFWANNNKKYNLNEINKDNKLLFIEFWTTWCSPCIQSIPTIRVIHEKYNQKIRIISINSNKRELHKVEEIIKNENMNWLQGFTNNDLKDKMDFDVYPKGYLFDSYGNLIMFNASPYKVLKYLDESYSIKK
jgi:thiol-disulfide isomerase/thioredoxin